MRRMFISFFLSLAVLASGVHASPLMHEHDHGDSLIESGQDLDHSEIAAELFEEVASFVPDAGDASLHSHAHSDIVDLNVFGATDVLTLGLVGFPPSIVAPPSLNQPPPSEPPLT